MSLLIAPSILSANFANLEADLKELEKAKADWIHVDVMDGHFVPNITIGPQVVKAMRKSTSLFFDVHLMIYRPFDYIEQFVEAGANSITIHFEATEDVEDILKYIRKCNIKAGLAFRLETSLSFIARYVPLCDLLLFMAVPPGFGGQPFSPDVVEKIAFTRTLCDRYSNEYGKTAPLLSVDGGINVETGKLCVQAGADVLVSGHALFSSADWKETINNLRKIR